MRNVIHQSNRLGNRERNEDRMASDTRGDTTLLVLADGLGGSGGGERAAQTAIDVLLSAFRKQVLPVTNPKMFLHNATQQAHQTILSLEKKGAEIPRTTIVACLIEQGRAHWVHTGDSRLYLIRQQQILVRTQDHTVVEYLRGLGMISERDLNNHPERHYVTSCLGASKTNPQLRISEPHPLLPGDKILLSSDGVWSALEQKILLEIVNTQDFAPALDQLTAQAEKHAWPNSDNASVIGYQYLAPQRLLSDAEPPIVKISNSEESLNQAIADIDLAYSLYDNELNSKS